MIQRQSLVVVLTLLSVSAVWSVARATSETSKVTGSIDIAPGEHTGDLSTVNGSIRVGQNAVVGRAHTVNGGISLERHASANGLKTVNGSIELAEAVRVRGDVHSVNGKLILENGVVRAGERNPSPQHAAPLLFDLICPQGSECRLAPQLDTHQSVAVNRIGTGWPRTPR